MVDLMDKKVVVTRPRLQANGFVQALRSAGAQPVCFPVIEIGQVEDTTALDRALGKLHCYDWLILTSVNGVEMVWERLETLGSSGLPDGLRVATIGPKTAASLRERRVVPDFVPDEYVAEAITPGLGDLVGRWVLLPRADLARPALADAIVDAGGVAHEIAAYRTLPATPDPEALDALRAGVDVITFTSSSTVHNFISLVRAAGLDPHQLPGNPAIACIGPVTAATAQNLGLPVSVIAREYTTHGLLQSLLQAQL